MMQSDVVEQIRQFIQRPASGESLVISDEDLAVLGARIADNVAKGLRSRVTSKRTEKKLYFSEIGTPCHRKVWYRYNGVEGEELSAPTIIKFMYGDILEELVLFLAEQAGAEVTERQAPREIPLSDGWKISGRIDAVINGQLVDVKSASTPSFNKICGGKLTEDDPFGYLSQLYGYWSSPQSEEQGDKHPAFLVIDKTLGNVGFASYAAHMSNEEVIRLVVDKGEKLKEDVLKSTPPDREYSPVADGKSGNMKLCTTCSYCPYKEECWKDSNGGKGLRTFFYSNGPRFLTTVAKEPDVPEKK